MSTTNLTTGNDNLDSVLGAGIPRGSVVLLAGPPGAGKTVLAQQAVFANASAELPALYLTTFSEPLPKVVRYLEGFSFYDPDRMYGPVLYRDLAQPIEARGVAAVPEIVMEMLEERPADLLVIDSFKALHELGERPEVFRMAVFRLARHVAALGVTTLWLGEYDGLDSERCPELAVADVVIELKNRTYGVRDERTLRVSKMRGAMPLPGEHTFSIRADGLQAFPRLVGADVVAAIGRAPERMSTGVDGLDPILGGGVWRGSSTFVLGPSGAGKTTLGLTLLAAGAREDETGMLVTLHETPEQVRRIVTGFAPEMASLFGDRLLVSHFSALEMDLVQLLASVKQAVSADRVQRIVIDSVRDLRDAAIDPSRLRATLYNLIQYCASHRIALFLNAETPILEEGRCGDPDGVASMVDNVLLLSYAPRGDVQHGVTAMKTRQSAHDPRLHGVHIDGRGYRVGAALDL